MEEREREMAVMQQQIDAHEESKSTVLGGLSRGREGNRDRLYNAALPASA